MKNNKILIKNIYYMLSYAFECLKNKDFDYISNEEFSDIHNLLGSILAKGTSFIVKRGLYKEYKNFEDNLVKVKGKILINETIKNRIRRNNYIYVSFDELSVNNLFNQIIKCAIYVLLKSPKLNNKIRKDLKGVLVFFDDVNLIDPNSIEFKNI